VGLTAGASAPEELVLNVIAALRRHGEIDVAPMAGIQENVEFGLPVELKTPSGATSVQPAQ
jgi:4-hydroxy-3-methylbut-2-enyl diphosphate reductase